MANKLDSDIIVRLNSILTIMFTIGFIPLGKV